MDEAFECPGFCATLRHSERFNSGVMVITPDSKVFKHMVEHISTVASYTGCVATSLPPFLAPARFESQLQCSYQSATCSVSKTVGYQSA